MTRGTEQTRGEGMARSVQFGIRISAALAALLAAACSQPQSAGDGGDSAPANRAGEAAPVSDAEEVNLDLWLERLEVGSRELYSARQAVVDAVGLEAGEWVADIGSGTGLYSLLFAEEVGAQGRVFAEDIEPLFLDLVARRAADADLDNITAVLGRTDNVTLPTGSVDVVFIADTYHYFDDREAVMRSVFSALKAGGSLILVEFDITPGEERADYKSHVRFGKDAVIAELEFIGFRFVGETEVEGLDESYFVTLEKPTE